MPSVNPSAGDRPQHSWRPLALALVILAGVVGLTRLLPPDVRPWNFAPVGALALFAGARLRPWQAVGLTTALMATSDLLLWWVRGDEWAGFVVYGCFLLYAALGHWLLANTESPWKIGGTVLVA